MSEVNLSKAVRSNLLSLQSTAAQMGKTQERLATGLKVNTALDNPTNFFTAASLNSRASDMANLLDSMSNGIKTIEAADNGVTSITKTVESMQSALRQARQDKSFKTESYTVDLGTGTLTGNESLDVTGGAFGTGSASIDLTTTSAPVSVVAASLTAAGGTAAAADPDYSALVGQTLTLDDGEGNTATYTFTASATGQKAQIISDMAAQGFTVTGGAGGLSVSRADGENFTVDTSNAATATAIGLADGAASTNGVVAVAAQTTAKSVDTLVGEINATTSAFAGKVRASNDNGKLRLENLSTEVLTVDGVSASGVVDGTSSGNAEVGANTVRKNLVTQFNELRDQLDKFADDASFNGINLLRGDKLKLTFNETGTSTIDIQAKNENGDPIAINNTTLGIDHVVNSDFDADATLDAKLEILGSALGKLRSQASSFGSNLSIVQNRTDFTKNMINTLETGAANLTLADTNEEAANLLALQTRQQLSSTALSMASQADQAVLRLF